MGTPAAVTIDGTTALTALTCRSITNCTAVDKRGHQIHFGSGTPFTGAIDRAVRLNDIACTATHTCLAVDNAGRLVTFDPAGSVAQQIIDPSTRSSRSTATARAAR